MSPAGFAPVDQLEERVERSGRPDSADPADLILEIRQAGDLGEGGLGENRPTNDGGGNELTHEIRDARVTSPTT